MRSRLATATLLLITASYPAYGQTALELNRQTKLKSGTTLPAQCAVGQLFFKTNAPTGTNLYACYTPNGWAIVGQGALGGGTSLLNGAGVPDPGTGGNGDFYLRTPGNCLYGPKAAGTWPGSCVSLVAGANGQLTYNNGGAAQGSNVAQNSDGSVTATKGFNAPFCVVPSSATLVFDAAQCNTFSLHLDSTTIAQVDLVNAKSGQNLTFIIAQDSQGQRPFSWPPNVQRACYISAVASTSTTVTAVFDGANANAIHCTTNDAATLIAGPTRVEPAPPTTGLSCWFDSQSNTLKCKDVGGNVHAAVLTAAGPTTNQFLTYIDSDGVTHSAAVSAAQLSDGVTGSGAVALSSSPTINAPTFTGQTISAGVSVGTDCVSRTYTTGTGAVTAKTLVALSSGMAVTAGTSGGPVYGIAKTGGAAGYPVEVCIAGSAQLTMDGTATVDNVATPSVTSAGQAHDSGQTSALNIAATAGVVGKIVSGCSGAGCTATVNIHAPFASGGLVSGAAASAAATMPLDAPPNSLAVGGNVYPGVSQTGLLADYRFTDGSGTTLKDYSTNANDGTLASGANAPAWVTSGLQGSTTTAKWVDVPGALNAAQTIIVLANVPLATATNGLASGSPIIWGPSVSGGPAMYHVQSVINGIYGVTRPGLVTGGTYSTAAGDNIAGTHALALVMGSGSPKDIIYVDGVPASYYSTQNSSLGIMSSGNYRLGSGVSGLGTGKFGGTFYRALFYNRQLTAAEVARVSAAITADVTQRGIPVNTPPKPLATLDNRLIAVGDSLTYGAGGTPYTSQLTLNDTFTIVNGGVNGQYAADMAASFTWGLRGSSSSGPKQVCVVFGGTNEAAGPGGTAANAAASIFRAVKACREGGLKAVVVTLLSQGGKEIERNAINALIRANWVGQADALADTGTDPLLGADGASSNSTYFTDPVHPNAAGNLRLANVISAAVNSLFLPAPIRIVGYEVGDGSAAITTAQLTSGGIAINNAQAKTLTEASCISLAGTQAVTVKIGGATLFSITCVPAANYSRSTANGTTGYINAASMGSTAVAGGAILDLSGTGGAATDIKLFAYGTGVN